MITDLIHAAAQLVGVGADCTLTETGYTLTLDGFPGEGGGYWNRSIRRAGPGPDWLPRKSAAPLTLPRGPIVAVDTVEYVDAAGDSQTLSPAAYRVALGRRPARMVPALGQSWPITADAPDVVTITYRAGFNAVPPVLIHAVKIVVGHLYENREAVAAGITLAELPIGLRTLIYAGKAGGAYA